MGEHEICFMMPQHNFATLMLCEHFLPRAERLGGFPTNKHLLKLFSLHTLNALIS